jgi:hypothetical protein
MGCILAIKYLREYMNQISYVFRLLTIDKRTFRVQWNHPVSFGSVLGARGGGSSMEEPGN